MTIEDLNKLCHNTLITHLDIVFTEATETSLKAEMPVSNKVTQPMGILHGGASLALAETVGSAGSFLLVDTHKYTVVGLQVSANHVGSVKSGKVIAEATVVHQGNTTHVWDVKISDDTGKLISVIRVTNFIKEISVGN